jgi:hypothetical protein
MSEMPTGTLGKHFAGLTHPRVERTREHKLLDIVILAICAVICGAEVGPTLKNSARRNWTGSRSFWNCRMGYPRMIRLGGCLLG